MINNLYVAKVFLKLIKLFACNSIYVRGQSKVGQGRT